jgi:hypothetical protein
MAHHVLGSSTMRQGIGLLVALFVSLARPARAQLIEAPEPVVANEAGAPGRSERSPSFADAPFAFGVRAGVGTTVGLLGLVSEYNVVQPLAVGVGVGLNGLGIEYGAQVRVRPIVLTSSKGQLHA